MKHIANTIEARLNCQYTDALDKMFKELVKFALYLNRTMPPYLNTTKDNVVTYYNQFVKNKLSTIR